MLDHVEAWLAEGRTAAGQAAMDEAIAYFVKHTGRVGYFGRLHTMRSSGSRAVEGLAKRMGRRLKAAGLRWCSEHLDGMTAMIVSVGTPRVRRALSLARRMTSGLESNSSFTFRQTGGQASE